NGSTDGSVEKLNVKLEQSSVNNLVILNKNFDNPGYALGSKYAEIVNTGFEWVKNSEIYGDLTHVGILDADCFPDIEYYEKLVNFLSEDKRIGITSGIIYDEMGRP